MLINGTTTDLDIQNTDHNDDTVQGSVPAEKQHNAPLPSTHAQAHKVKERRCIVSKETYSQDELIRFVLSPDDIVTPDIENTLPGRGAWVKADKDSLEKAIQDNLFAKSFKQKSIIPDDLQTRVVTILRNKALSMLSLSRRSGDCIIGFDKAYNAAQKTNIAVYITASAEGTDSRQKIKNTLSSKTEIVSCWDADTLSKTFGTENTNHAVIKQSGIANKFIKEYRKLCAFGV